MVAGEIRDIGPPALETVPIDHTLDDVIEVMLENNFSQIGLTRDDTLIGMISFQSIARAMIVTDRIHQPKRPFAERAAELAVEQPTIEGEDDELDELFDLLRTNSYVITVDDEGGYGIVTDYDIREFYSKSLTPFLLIGETENAIRSIIREVLNGDLEVIIADMSRNHEEFERVDSLEKCGFTHYSRLLSVHWDEEFSTHFNEHRDFVRCLIETLAEERNRLFHFRIGGQSPIDMDIIRLANNYFTSICTEDIQRVRINTSHS